VVKTNAGAEMEKELIHKELSESIIGAAMTVLNALRPGLDEKLYERALVIELRKRGHTVEPQRQYPVFYDDQHIGTLVPDLIVDNAAIVDCKVVTTFTDTHAAQMLGYLNSLRLALLLNFKNVRLEWRRVVA
jgi:GxxExxY protein